MGVSFQELWQALGILPRRRVIDTLIDDGYRVMNEREWRLDLDNSPHGSPWGTSFHASSFPGDDPKSCDRLALYGLLGAPAAEPFDRRGRAYMDSGKDAERQIVTRLHHLGVLLSEPPWSRVQTGLVLPSYWLTGNTDAVLLPPGYASPHPLEIKGGFHEKIVARQKGEIGPDPIHVRQAKTYIGLARILANEHWPMLKPAHDGTLLYVSRDKPFETVEFLIAHDQGFMDAGLDALRRRQRLYLDERLPARDKSWKYTEAPCKWCSWKKSCKADTKADVVKIGDSSVVTAARALMPTYSYDASRAALLKRWYNDMTPTLEGG